MTKTEMFNALGGLVSKTAIRLVDEEWRVVGKFCYISPTVGGWDVWICNPRNLTAGLTNKKVSYMLKNLRENGKIRELDGEALGVVQGGWLDASNLRVLGVRLKRQVSDENREKARQRFLRVAH